MRILLDECLPRKLKHELPDHNVFTVPEMGWASIQNGALLALMEPVFDVFITVDGNLRHQQNMRGRNIIVIVLSAPDNTIETLQPLMPQMSVELAAAQQGQIIRVSS